MVNEAPHVWENKKKTVILFIFTWTRAAPHRISSPDSCIATRANQIPALHEFANGGPLVKLAVRVRRGVHANKK